MEGDAKPKRYGIKSKYFDQVMQNCIYPSMGVLREGKEKP
jgi:hypothetical protein